MPWKSPPDLAQVQLLVSFSVAGTVMAFCSYSVGWDQTRAISRFSCPWSSKLIVIALKEMFQFSTCEQEGIFIFPLLRLFVNRQWVCKALIQKSVKSILRFKTLMTNKTEHDSHGSKTVEISDMKYNIFKVRNLLYPSSLFLSSPILGSEEGQGLIPGVMHK